METRLSFSSFFLPSSFTSHPVLWLFEACQPTNPYPQDLAAPGTWVRRVKSRHQPGSSSVLVVISAFRPRSRTYLYFDFDLDLDLDLEPNPNHDHDLSSTSYSASASVPADIAWSDETLQPRPVGPLHLAKPRWRTSPSCGPSPELPACRPCVRPRPSGLPQLLVLAAPSPPTS